MSARGIVTIGGSLLLAIFVVGASIYYQGGSAAAVSGGASVIVTKAAQKEYIEAIDSDGDGVPDWEQSLRAHILERVAVPPLGTTTNAANYTPPDTYTGQFAEQFFASYLEEKKLTGAVEDPTNLVNRAVTSIQAQAQNKRFSRGEIVIVPDSLEAARAYGNNMVIVTKRYPVMAESEVLIFQYALESNDREALLLLNDSISAYENLLKDTLTMATPEKFVRAHLDLLNVYHAIVTDLKAMRNVFDDPLYALARLEPSFANSGALFPAFLTIINILLESGVRYADNEPGAELLKFAL